ncbi:hypothetical protein [Acidianus brierleyi]|uniref:Uncharacterized protein n=1 Tax=Acidianus brierleyi TaxID=41673 RepID=A0A2U9IF56_9CREN|nr:hypothetical protein [Acidianus brierleyi]AWR94615.1 hypothetical protein DFR85_08445 [Acidianus brierleyi]
MSNNKEFIRLQDLILEKTSLEKVKLHIENRKEKTVYKWVSSELSGFLIKHDKDLNPYVEKIISDIKAENYSELLSDINATIDIISKKINELYDYLSNS